jgi:hypothetical protein
MVKSVLIGAVALLLSLAGCSKRNVDSLEAVRQGVIRDISKNVNVGAMDVKVVSVSFRDKEADAVVSFAPKGGTPQQGLTMNYTLERQGPDWHIKKRAQGDLQRHAAQPPPGATTGGGASGGDSSQLPPGHPSLNGGGQAPPADGGTQLPPGHPPQSGSSKP